MKRTYDDRRRRDDDRDRDEGSYYRDPSSLSQQASPRASTSVGSPPRGRTEEEHRHRESSTRRRSSRDGAHHHHHQSTSSSHDSRRGHTRPSSEKDRPHSRDRQHDSYDRKYRDERDRGSNARNSNASMSPRALLPSSLTALATATVREASPEEGEITPPPPPQATSSQRTSHPSSSSHPSHSHSHSHSSNRPSASQGSSSRRHEPSRQPNRDSHRDTARARPSTSSRPETSKESAVEKAEAEEEVDYDSIYEVAAAKAAPVKKTPAELLEEKRKARAAILDLYQREKQRSQSATPQPEASGSGASQPLSARASIPGTPSVATSADSPGIASAVQKLKVEASATGSNNNNNRSRPGTPLRNNEDGNGTDSDDEDEGGHKAAAEQRRRDEEDLRNLEEAAKLEASGPPKEALNNNGQAGEDVSAADYDPEDGTMFDDRREREKLFMDQNEQPGNQARQSIGHAVATGQASARPVMAAIVEASMQVEEADEGDDDDEDDMFAVNKKVKKPRLDLSASGTSKSAYVPVINRSLGTSATAGDSAAPLIVDNFDDAEGYYRVILGEVLDGDRYHLTAHLGKGMFSNVVRARDRQSPLSETGADGEETQYREVAIKIMRSQESMYRAGQKEAVILRKLIDADPQDKKHLIRLERTFEHRGHLCLVFENLSMNLRDVIKRFGKDVGINLKAVRAYAHQIFLALNLLSKLNIMHADIKPDNILVNESKSLLKVCDLGSAADTSEAEITPYLVSRFYRAPEIILGLPYDCSLDMWSIGCTLYELYTGKILFPGRSNNHMLYLVQELKGRYPARLVKKAKFGDIHFEDSNFVFVEKNKATGAESIKKMIIPPKGNPDLKARLMPPATVKKLPEDELKLLTNFVNLLDRALELDPAKRLTPKEALNHPFLR